jgi:hypothetical protein
VPKQHDQHHWKEQQQFQAVSAKLQVTQEAGEQLISVRSSAVIRRAERAALMERLRLMQQQKTAHT